MIQKRYGRIPSRFREKPSTVPSAFSNWPTDTNVTRHRVGNRCFKCWMPGCFVRVGTKPRDVAPILKNIDMWKRTRGLPQRAINFAEIQTFDVEPFEISEAFMGALAIEHSTTNNSTSEPEEVGPINNQFFTA